MYVHAWVFSSRWQKGSGGGEGGGGEWGGGGGDDGVPAGGGCTHAPSMSQFKLMVKGSLATAAAKHGPAMSVVQAVKESSVLLILMAF